MKLYYARGACSLAPHIVAQEAGLALDLVKVDTKTHELASGGDFYRINPKGYVPALQLDDGEILTEGPAIMQFLGDRAPESGLVPPNGTMDRYRLQEMLGFINSEVHKTYSPLFDPATPQAARDLLLEKLRKRYALLDARLQGREYLFGNRFGAADAYLYVVTSWAKYVKLDLAPYANVQAHHARVAARPAVQAAQKSEV